MSLWLAVSVGVWVVGSSAVGASGPLAGLVLPVNRAPDGAMVASLTAELEAAGYSVRRIEGTELSDPDTFAARRPDLMVLLDAGSLPARATRAFDGFVRSGGDVIALGAPLWQRPQIRTNDGWRSCDEAQIAGACLAPPNVVFDLSEQDLIRWRPVSNEPRPTASYRATQDGPVPPGRAVHVRVSDMRGWEMYASPEVTSPFPPGHTLTVFSARGSERTTQLSIEWMEKDGSRWIAVVPLSQEWRRYVLGPGDFKYWKSNPARGGRNDRLNPANAVCLQFGLAYSHGGTGGPHEYWVGPIGTAAETPELRELVEAFAPLRLETLSPGYKYFECREVSGLRWRPEQTIVEGPAPPRPARIRSSHPRASGAGSGKGRDWRWVSLLEAVGGPSSRPSLEVGCAGGGRKGSLGDDQRSSSQRAAPGNTGAAGGGSRIERVDSASTGSAPVSSDGRVWWRGTPVTLLLHASGPFAGGAWAAFGVEDEDWYRSAGVIAAIGQIARRIREAVFIVDAGADHYTYFEGQPVTLGLRVCDLAGGPRTGLTGRIVVTDSSTGAPAFETQWPLQIPAGPCPAAQATVSTTWRPTGWPNGGYVVVAELVEAGRVLDRVRHGIHVWRPKAEPSYVRVRDGDFVLDGRRWRVHGVNYMPSSGIAMEDYDYFEHWTGARAYDPEIIDRDLDHICDIGMNAVSIFTDHKLLASQNVLDLLRRIDGRGLKANLSIRPGTPMDFQWSKVREVIERYRLAEQDVLFAYDLAWEPMFGPQEERRIWDRRWETWIVERYGSLEEAERDWGFPVPRDAEGRITNPSAEQTRADGPWRRMTAAYRRFLDTLLYEKYAAARRLVRGIDPNHLVSFRMAYAGDPTFRWAGCIPYDWPYLAAAVDILEPEGYGRIGGWDRVRPGWFQHEYGRWAGPDRPIVWAEMGVSTWSQGQSDSSAGLLGQQADFYREFYRMLIASGADGVFAWWYPGGFRCYENSDYGIIHPDGTDRPVTRVLREMGPRFLNGPDSRTVDYWIEFDRDEHPDGIAGVYDKVASEFWKAIEEGRAPGLRTAGTGTSSADCPLVAVGNTPLTGSNPPKYLDGWFDLVEVFDAADRWTPVEADGQVRVRRNREVLARLTLTNLGEAMWKAATDPGRPERGAVGVAVEGPVRRTAFVPRDVPRHGTVRMESVVVAPPSLAGPAEVRLRLEAAGRASFGPRFRVTLVPEAGGR